MDKFLKNLGSLAYEKTMEFKEVTAQVSELLIAAKPDITIQSVNLESAFQGVIASMLGCVSKFTPPQTRNALAFWTLISNQDLDRWELSKIMNQHELIKLGDEVDNKKLSHYFDEIRSTLKICMNKKYYGGFIASMPTEEQKAILFEVLKKRGDDDKLLEIADEATEINKFQAAIDLIDYALQINPENKQAKQKLLELYPKAIQEVIDEGRCEDAYHLTASALKIFKNNKSLFLLRLKSLALLFISKFYPEKEFYFEGVWESLQGMDSGKLSFKPSLTAGIALTGNEHEKEEGNVAALCVSLALLRYYFYISKSEFEVSEKLVDNKIVECARQANLPENMITNIVSFLNEVQQ